MLEERKDCAFLLVTGGVPVVQVNGELDLTNVAAMHAVLQSAAEHDAGVVVVSLDGAQYFDSATLHTLFMFRHQLGTNRQRLLIVAPKLPTARRVLEIAGLSPQHETLEEALAAAAAIVAERFRALEFESPDRS
jgi:anti-anti-sigma factor